MGLACPAALIQSLATEVPRVTKFRAGVFVFPRCDERTGSRENWGVFISINSTGHQVFFFQYFIYLFIYSPFIFISWRLIPLQYCGGFCHTLT